MNAALSKDDRQLLLDLVKTRGPSGDERDVTLRFRPELERVMDEVWVDPAGNLVSVLKAENPSEEPVIAISHMDEIAMIVKRIEPDGTLRITNLGGDLPISFGQCAVDILADGECLQGVLSLGSLHRTNHSADMADIRRDGAQWDNCYIITGMSREELAESGVHAGTRVVLSVVERELIEVGELLGAHFMDDRALMLAGLMAMRSIRDRRAEMTRDVYYVCSTKEEVTNGGAKYAARTLPGHQMIALEVGPVAPEYDTVLDARPILSFGDQKGLYSPKLIDDIRDAAECENIGLQLALLEFFASDASAAISDGLKPQAAVICMPTQNTHGFELVHRDGFDAFAKVLAQTLVAGHRNG
ncbi:M42 family peptidase [Jiella endophytica]|uniref:M42 family peptidase n=1 Tax=Jiella endophytica TaxID=2558362 RepID=A0A4Y8R958_9HYPH|nr:M42 family peptidase [Jiella endophytica]TFF17609.1 M42 family peptidase [Jiella endophytica]